MLLVILQIFSVRAHSDTVMHNSTVIEQNSTTLPGIDQENQFTSELTTTEVSTPTEKSDFNTTDDSKPINPSIEVKMEPEEEIKNETMEQTQEKVVKKAENVTTKPFPYPLPSIANNFNLHQQAFTSMMASLVTSYLSTLTSLMTIGSQLVHNRTLSAGLRAKNSTTTRETLPTAVPQAMQSTSAGNITENPPVQRMDMTEVPNNTTIDFFGSSESLTDDIIDADYDFDDLEYDNENITGEFGIFRMDLGPTTVSPSAGEKKTKKLSSHRPNHQATSEQNIESLLSNVNFSLNSNSSRKNASASQKLPFSSKYSKKIPTTRIPRIRNHKKLHGNHTKAPKAMKKRQVQLATDYDVAERPDLASYFRNAEIIRENYLNSGKGSIDQEESQKKDFPPENWRDPYAPYAMTIENRREAILPAENTQIQPQASQSALENPPPVYFVDDVDYSQLQDSHRLPMTMNQRIRAIDDDEQSVISRENKNLWTIGQSVETKRKKKSNVEPTVTKNNKTREKRPQRARSSLHGHKTSSKNHRTSKNRKGTRKGKPRTSKKHSHTRTRSKTRGNSRQSKKPSHQHKHQHQARSTFY